MSRPNNKKSKKKTRAGLVVFIIELIVLVILAGAIFVYARINSGLRNIGLSAGSPQTAAGTAPEGGSGQVVAGEGAAEPAGSVPAADGTVVADAPVMADAPVVKAVHERSKADFDADAADENIEVSKNDVIRDYTNIALVGIDSRDNADLDYANSDTMLVCSINNRTGQVRMISIYRDTLLNIGENLTYNVKQGDADDGDYGDYDDYTDDAYNDVVDDGGYDDGGYDDGGYDDGGYDDGGYDGGDDGGGSYDGGDDGGGSYDGGNDGGSYDGGNGGGGSYDSGSDGGSYDYDSDGGNSSSGGSSGSNTQGGSNAQNGSSSSEGSGSASASEERDSSSGQSGNTANYTINNVFDPSTDSAVTEVITSQLGETQAEGNYDKANAAYQNGSARQLLGMLNKNLDLNIHEYVVVEFGAVAKLVDDLDGIDVWMTQEEVIHMNNYCVETSQVTGLPYEPIEAEEMPREYHLNGVQAVSYARIRYTTGNDMKRSQRQRVVIHKVVDKAKKSGLKTVQAIIQDVFPMCKTSFSVAEIIQMASQAFGYEIEKTSGFPFTHLEKTVYVGSHSIDAVIPVTLEDNVVELHEFLFDEKDYKVSDTVKTYSKDIETLSNLTEKNRATAEQNSVIGQSGGEADLVA